MRIIPGDTDGSVGTRTDEEDDTDGDDTDGEEEDADGAAAAVATGASKWDGDRGGCEDDGAMSVVPGKQAKARGHERARNRNAFDTLRHTSAAYRPR